MNEKTGASRGLSPDTRLLGKPVSNDGTLEIMEYDWRKLPLTSENIWHAQMAGWCTILTYDYVADKTERSRNRREKRTESLDRAGVVSKPALGWRDEYPFASTIENNGSVFVGHAPAAEQRIQAGMISAFFQKYRADSCMARTGRAFFFEVRVTNFPQGDIKRPDTTWR